MELTFYNVFPFRLGVYVSYGGPLLSGRRGAVEEIGVLNEAC